jgi:outer membrane protein OmpA-like peptidoglycan-associated protein
MYRTTTKFALLLLVTVIFTMNLLANDIIENASTSSNDMLIAQVNSNKYLYGIKLESSDGGGDATGAGIITNKKLRIINLGPVVNTEFDDYAPTVTGDGKTIYFVSNRPGSKKLPNNKNSTDFWAFKKEHKLDTVFTMLPFNIDESVDNDQLGVNTILNEGVATITADGKTLYFTGCNRPDGYGDCDIYRVTLEGDVWGKPVNLGKNVNSEYFDSQPSITPDGTRLYFTSTRKGPNSSGRNKYEEMDIWYSDWDDDMDEWGPAKNLEAINTKGKDCSPFICSDGRTLIFSSDAHSVNYGGLDFYITTYSPSTRSWSKPTNLGEPLNTKFDEQFMTMPASGDIIYFSSNRTDLSAQSGKSDLDLYVAVVPTYKRTVLITGKVVDECTGDLIFANIILRNKLTNKLDTIELNESNQEFSYVVTYDAFGDDDNLAGSVDYDVTSVHPKFGTKTVKQTVKRYMPIEDREEAANKHAEHIKITIPMGERPKLVAKIEESEYIRKSKTSKPNLANFNGLVMEEILNWSLHPLLTYVFFDEGSSEFPSRYKVFKSANETRMFSDTTIVGATLDKYYHILNIFGFRLTKHPDVTIEIVGCNDAVNEGEKRKGLSKERADNVYNYLKDIWKISPDRMKLTYRDLPANPSNSKDSLGQIENRRVEILCNEWDVFKPVFDKDVATLPQPDDMIFQLFNGIDNDIVASRKVVIKRGDEDWVVLDDIGITEPTYTWDWTSEDGKYPVDNAAFTAQMFVTTKSGAVCSSDPIEIPTLQVSTEERIIATGEGKTRENYSLILFPFGKHEAGPVNERVMRDYVYNRVMQTSDIKVIGHTDIVGLFDFNVNLSKRRANTVRQGIHKHSGGRYKSLDVNGVGPEDPIYPNEIPEGRFYNRTVQVLIESVITTTQE